MKKLKELRASRTVNEKWWFKVKKYDCVKLPAMENRVENQVMCSMKRQVGLLNRCDWHHEKTEEWGETS